MTFEQIKEIEDNFPTDGLAGYLFWKLTNNNYDNLISTAYIIKVGACSVLNGSAPIEERREMFLKVYDGCKTISKFLKDQVDYDKLINDPILGSENN